MYSSGYICAFGLLQTDSRGMLSKAGTGTTNVTSKYNNEIAQLLFLIQRVVCSLTSRNVTHAQRETIRPGEEDGGARRAVASSGRPAIHESRVSSSAALRSDTGDGVEEGRRT